MLTPDQEERLNHLDPSVRMCVHNAAVAFVHDEEDESTVTHVALKFMGHMVLKGDIEGTPDGATHDVPEHRLIAVENVMPVFAFSHLLEMLSRIQSRLVPSDLPPDVIAAIMDVMNAENETEMGDE